jgi:ArsR family transcriptional regulator
VEAVLASRRATSRTFFRTAAARWDALREELFGDRLDLHIALGLLDPESLVGDLGCGTGHLTSILSPVVRRVIAVDGSEDMLGAARGRLNAAPNVEFRLGDLENLPIANGELDVAALSLVLHYVAEPQAALSEAHRVLKPGGRLVVLDMLPHSRAEYREQMGHVWQGFSETQVTEWMTAVGFEAVRVRTLPMDAHAKGPEMFVATGRAGNRE